MPILVEGQGAVPGVQVHSNDGALAEPRGELHFVPFVLEVTFKQIQMDLIFLNQGSSWWQKNTKSVIWAIDPVV